MSEFDVRQDIGPVSKIRVSASDTSYSICELIAPFGGGIYIYDSPTDPDDGLKVKNRDHAENLIKGLKKAIELGWL